MNRLDALMISIVVASTCPVMFMEPDAAPTTTVLIAPVASRFDSVQDECTCASIPHALPVHVTDPVRSISRANVHILQPEPEQSTAPDMSAIPLDALTDIAQPLPEHVTVPPISSMQERPLHPMTRELLEAVTVLPDQNFTVAETEEDKSRSGALTVDPEASSKYFCVPFHGV